MSLHIIEWAISQMLSNVPWGFQLICLYLWYFPTTFLGPTVYLLSLSIGHVCGLVLPDRWKSKQFFALIGVSGAIFALGYPVFDPLSLILRLSFLLGHYMSLIIPWFYLLRWYESDLLKIGELFSYLCPFGPSYESISCWEIYGFDGPLRWGISRSPYLVVSSV